MSAVTSPPGPSSLTSLISTSGSGSDPLSALTTQILYNLQHQHYWTSLRIHEPSKPRSPSFEKQPPPPTPLISGIPPHRVYTHPDEQLYMLEKGLREEDLIPERIFVLPTAQGQSWSLRKLAQVFDSLPEAEEQPQTLVGRDDTDGPGKEKAAKLVEYYERREKARATKEWGGKRLLLAMVDKGMGGDGTVVYYVVQEGTVKPRQN